ncbi:MAG: hypothetical protein GY742_08045 [Hyphomicrobiales bacterium]|nr:hypothetical protein [Hyphomicrobiales bacterium]
MTQKFKKFVPTAAIIGVFAFGTVQADAVTYDNFAAFDAANTIAYTEDFQTLADATAIIAGPRNFAGTGLTVFSSSQELFSAATGHSTNTSVAIGSDDPYTDFLGLSLGGIFNAAGLNIYQNYEAGSQTNTDQPFDISLYLANVLVTTIATSVAPNGGSYFGFDGFGIFDEIRVFSTSGIDGLFEVVDNVSVGNHVVPIPAALPLLGTGLALMGIVGWRRKRKIAA